MPTTDNLTAALSDYRITPTPPSGTRDFFGADLRRRDLAVATIKQVFERRGFDPLETPAFERIEILTGKYGDDEKLIYKVAKRGAKEARGEADLALRYDFTVPLARFVAGNQELASRILRIYRIGPVWRADRPARGRFREFYQCDIDIVGSSSPIADAEVQLAVANALNALSISDFEIHLNSRRLLNELVCAYGVPASMVHQFFVAVDKLHKIGTEEVLAELSSCGVPDTVLSYINDDLKEENRGDAVVARLGLAGSSEGLEEVRVVKRLVNDSLPAGRVVFDPFITRGLYYYTGPVFEVFHGGTEKPVLSIASGGRYDDLIEMFSQRPIPACGGSLGFERILRLLQEVPTTPIYSDVLVTIWDNESSKEMIALAEQLRTAGIRVEVSLNPGSLGPQLCYATQRDMVVALICGPAERVAGRVIVKDLQSGKQTAVAESDVVELARRTLIANGRM